MNEDKHPMWTTYFNSAYNCERFRTVPEPWRSRFAEEKADTDFACWEISMKRVNKRGVKGSGQDWTNFVHETGKAS